MKPLDKEQKGELLHLIGNGLTPIRNYMELARGDATEAEMTNHISRSIAAIDALYERIRKEFGE